ncbi:MAG TPA: preprotein translocase subunit SecE [Acidimicrobiales bacterium]|nr:preprotein translocase subunit SecE [Acidimicrobiales bacterium]
MNRETRRLLQRQGQLGADGAPTTRRAPAQAPRRPPEGQRPSFARRVGTFLREVRGELSKVLWPRRAEVINYSTVVLTTLVIVALLIFGLNYAFAKGVVFLFQR